MTEKRGLKTRPRRGALRAHLQRRTKELPEYTTVRHLVRITASRRPGPIPALRPHPRALAKPPVLSPDATRIVYASRKESRSSITTRRTGTSTWRGPSSRPRTSPCSTTPRPSASTIARRPRPRAGNRVGSSVRDSSHPKSTLRTVGRSSSFPNFDSAAAPRRCLGAAGSAISSCVAVTTDTAGWSSAGRSSLLLGASIDLAP